MTTRQLVSDGKQKHDCAPAKLAAAVPVFAWPCVGAACSAAADCEECSWAAALPALAPPGCIILHVAGEAKR
jgi:hypothetical protein